MLKIRPARPEDAAIIIDFQIAMALETENLHLDPLKVQLGVGAVFADERKGTYWVAADENEILASMLTIPEWSDWRNGTAIWIHSVYVRPNARRCGIFRALYLHLRRQVESDSRLTALRLYVDKRNKTAQRVYEELGMSAEHYDLFEWQK